MLGNVWEWCRDMWDPRGYLPVVQIDPVHTGFTAVIRGGCYYSEPAVLRCAKRFGYFQAQGFGSVGFRVISEVT
jgi:formylglycine-generating enzyme required for sulfatase activity